MEVKNDIVSLLRTAREHGISVFQDDNKLKLKIDRDKTANPEIIALLKDQKQEILDFLNDGMGNLEQITSTEDAIKPFDRNGIDKIPPSFSQEQLWFIDQLEGSVQYHQPMALHLKSRLDKKTLEAALSDLITRHEVLRTVIRAEEGKPYQVILLPDDWKMGFSEGDSFKDEAFLVGFIESEFSRPFKLSDDYMLRAHLIRID